MSWEACVGEWKGKQSSLRSICLLKTILSYTYYRFRWHYPLITYFTPYHGVSLTTFYYYSVYHQFEIPICTFSKLTFMNLNQHNVPHATWSEIFFDAEYDFLGKNLTKLGVLRCHPIRTKLYCLSHGGLYRWRENSFPFF